MGNVMDNSISITLTPTYKIIAPKIFISVNNKVLFNDVLKDTITLKESFSKKQTLKITITRTGRDKNIIKNDSNNNFSIKEILVNQIPVNPLLGSFFCKDNDYLDPHTVHDTVFNLNGEYILEIPFLPLTADRIKVENIKRFNTKNTHNDFVFFGSSMTHIDFMAGNPPIPNKKSFADLLLEKVHGINLGLSGLNNQQIFENVYYYFKTNTAKYCFVDVQSPLARQVKDKKTGRVANCALDKIKDYHKIFDIFTNQTIFNIKKYFFFPDVRPLLALQLSEYQDLIDYVEGKKCKIFFISYHADEFPILQKKFPTYLAPFFTMDRNSEYFLRNYPHPTWQEHEAYYQVMFDFIQKTIYNTHNES